MGRELAVSYLLQHLAMLLGRQRPPLFRSPSHDTPSMDAKLDVSKVPLGREAE
jgi:hypothetical protein